jgi:hypothetical protein
MRPYHPEFSILRLAIVEGRDVSESRMRNARPHYNAARLIPLPSSKSSAEGMAG